jgi:hypothetical protein
MELYAIGVGESVRAYKDKLPTIFSNHKTITIHNGINKLYEHYGLICDYYTWGDPFGSLHGLRFLDSLEDVVSTVIIVPETMSKSYDYFRQHHGTTRASTHWDEYIGLINKLSDKGFNVVTVPTRTTKEKYPTLDERFGHECMWMGTVPYGGDASEARSSAETKLTSLLFPLAHYMGFNTVKVLGFDCIGGRFYDAIDGVPQQPWPSHQLPMLQDNMRIWQSWKSRHNMSLISVVEDKYTINNKELEYEAL